MSRHSGEEAKEPPGFSSLKARGEFRAGSSRSGSPFYGDKKVICPSTVFKEQEELGQALYPPLIPAMGLETRGQFGLNKRVPGQPGLYVRSHLKLERMRRKRRTRKKRRRQNKGTQETVAWELGGKTRDSGFRHGR